MASHVEQAVAARIAAAKRRAEEQQRQREELAAARAAGVARRHAQKLFRQAHAQSQTPEDPMPAAIRSVHCPACRCERVARLVAAVVVSRRPYNVLRCTADDCGLQWLVPAEPPRTAPAAA